MTYFPFNSLMLKSTMRLPMTALALKSGAFFPTRTPIGYLLLFEAFPLSLFRDLLRLSPHYTPSFLGNILLQYYLRNLGANCGLMHQNLLGKSTVGMPRLKISSLKSIPKNLFCVWQPFFLPDSRGWAVSRIDFGFRRQFGQFV